MMLNQRYMGKLASPWDEIAIAHLLVIVYTKDNNFEEAYKEQAILAKRVSLFLSPAFLTASSQCIPSLLSNPN